MTGTDISFTWLISIHALREEGDARSMSCRRKSLSISIHALREEGDYMGGLTVDIVSLFLSTPSARRATCCSEPGAARTTLFLSTPSARRATPNLDTGGHGHDNFYPRPPRGGRRGKDRRKMTAPKFLSTPSARRATLHFSRGWSSG